MSIGKNLISVSNRPLVYRVENHATIGLTAPEVCLGDSLRTVVKSLSGFQKEALVTQLQLKGD
ncbi:MAG: hypothetical protein AAFQ84_01770 [Pseudomonadota bacterium]